MTHLVDGLLPFPGMVQHRPKLNFTCGTRNDGTVSLAIQHDEGKAVAAWCSSHSFGLEMPGECWAKVIPALVVRLPDGWREECLKAIAERVV